MLLCVFTNLQRFHRCSYFSAFHADTKRLNTPDSTEFEVLIVFRTWLLSIDIRKLVCLEVLLASSPSL